MCGTKIVENIKKKIRSETCHPDNSQNTFINDYNISKVNRTVIVH